MSLGLKEKYMNELLTWMIVGDDGITCNAMLREEAYIDLAIIEAKEIDHDWSKGDRDFFMKTKHFERTSIKLEEILSESDEFVVVRGIAGIGKTSMVDSYVLKWAQGELLNGKDNSQQIDILFKLTCRNVNTFSNVFTAEDLLRAEYARVLKDIEFEDLEDISHRIVILIDGVDELQSLHELNNVLLTTEIRTELPPLVRSVYELIDTHSNTLARHKTIIAARPEACQIVDAVFKGKIKIKMVEVCGFNSNSVNVYVDNYFGNQQHMAETVKNKINESENLSVMASIPVYTWVICAIFNEDTNIESPRTTTHLCSYACLLFLRNHLKKSLHNPIPINCSLLDIINNEDVIHVILNLAELSKSTLKYKKVVFSKKDFKSKTFCVPLEETGFIVKDQVKSVYQFRHLVLQEYLAALHFYVMSPHISKIFNEVNYISCIPIIAGLSGIENVTDGDPIAYFVTKLKEYSTHTVKVKLRRLFVKNNTKVIVQRWLERMLGHQYNDNGKLVIGPNCSSLLASFYECQGNIFVNSLENASVVFTDIIFHHDIRNALYLFSKLKSIEISEIYITNTSNKKFPQNLIELFKLFFIKGNKICGLRVTAGDVMKVFSMSDKRENILTIQLNYNELDTLDTHGNFLSAAFTLVDTVTLDYSLGDIYPQIRQLIKSMEILKNIKFSGKPSTANKKMTPFNLLFFIDSETDKSTLELDFSNFDIGDEHIQRLKPLFTYLEKLDLRGNSKMSSQSMKYISDVLMQSIEENKKCSLKVINIGYCDLTDQHIEYLQPCIPYLQSLNVSGNNKLSMGYISDILIKANKIHGCGNLKEIYIADCDLTDKNIEYLQPCVPYLESLILSINGKMTSKSMGYISDVLIRTIENHKSCNLKGIEIRNCDLTDQHIKCLQPCIPYLENVNIGSNSEMSSKSMEYICNVLVQNNFCNLKFMDISYCNLTDEHVKCLQPCIPYMEHLNISGNNKMSFLSMKYISDVLVKVIKLCETSKPNDIEISKTYQIKGIDIGFCELTDQHIAYLQPCIPYLENLTISGNKFLTYQGMAYISVAIMQRIGVNKTCNTKTINASYCDLQDYAIGFVAPCLPYLERFFINGNKDLSDSSIELISDNIGIA